MAMANGVEYGLISYAYTESLERGHRLIERLESGMVGLNAGVISNAAALRASTSTSARSTR